MTALRRWIVQVLIALDQLINALFGGWADESLSAHAWRANWTWRIRLIDALFFWQERHCARAFAAEKARRHLPPEYRNG